MPVQVALAPNPCFMEVAHGNICIFEGSTGSHHAISCSAAPCVLAGVPGAYRIQHTTEYLMHGAV